MAFTAVITHEGPLLGHRSMDMTLAYAPISDYTVAEAYFR